MSGKGKLVTPKQYAEIHGIAYTTVMHWLQTGRVEGAIKHETPRGPYWELPENTPRPKKLSGRPKKQSDSETQISDPDAQVAEVAEVAPDAGEIEEEPAKRRAGKKAKKK